MTATLPAAGAARRARGGIHPVAACALSSILLAAPGCASGSSSAGPSPAGVQGSSVASPPSVNVASAQEADRFRVVDCLLPGQVRRLGTMTTYVSRPRLVEAAAHDCEIRGGEYVVKDPASYAAALGDWREKAEGGDIQAMLYVAEIYERGLAGVADPAKAADWYRRAADKGSAEAMVGLATLYERGAGVPLDKTEAARWYLRARGVPEDQLAAALEPAASTQSAQVARLRDELERAEADRNRLRAEIAALQQSLAEAQTGGADTQQALEAQRQRDQAQIDRLQQDLDARDRRSPPEERERLRAQIADLQRALDQAKTGSASAEQTLEAERQRWQAQVDRLQQDLDAKDREIAEIHEKAQQTRGEGSVAATAGAFSGLSFGNYYALVIGNRNYQDPTFPNLKNPQRDARAIAEMLQSDYGMQVTLVLDGTRGDIWGALGRIDAMTGPGDNLLVYYAGHGKLVEIPDRQYIEGYWLPVDSSPTNPANWIDTDEINKFMKRAHPKHIMVIADSCYAGTQFRSVPEVIERRELLERLNQKEARVLLTSGGQEDKVLDAGFGDHSVFAQVLLDTLGPNQGVLLGSELFEKVRPQVVSAAHAFRHEQTPEYGPIQFAGDQGGEFFFVPKGAATADRVEDPRMFAATRLLALGHDPNGRAAAPVR